jgi:hypothetical protein
MSLYSSQVVGQTEEADPMHPNLDDFTGLLDQDDARMLVDLLKLAVAARAGDTAKETIVTVLVGKCTSCVNTCIELISVMLIIVLLFCFHYDRSCSKQASPPSPSVITELLLLIFSHLLPIFCDFLLNLLFS